nr:MAG TPA: hypothetical protein [Caudoviricetes sp.]
MFLKSAILLPQLSDFYDFTVNFYWFVIYC